MAAYIVKRVLLGVVTLWFIITITFFLMHSIPGGPFNFDSLDRFPRAVQESLKKSYGLDQPLFVQYFTYMRNLLRGEMGVSITYAPRTVVNIIQTELPVTLRLSAISFLFTAAAGVAWGVLAAVKQGKWQDNLTRVVTVLGITIPGFVVATLLIYFFAVRLRWLPPMGIKSWKSYIMPALALSFSSVAYLSRLTRSNFLDIIRQDYIRTARAKGLTERVVIFKHGLKNCLIPIVTYLGPLLSAMVIGSFVIERIFAIPGLGREMVLSISDRDYMMIPALTAFYSMILISISIVVDILYVLIDPRVVFTGREAK